MGIALLMIVVFSAIGWSLTKKQTKRRKLLLEN